MFLVCDYTIYSIAVCEQYCVAQRAVYDSADTNSVHFVVLLHCNYRWIRWKHCCG
jgi:hypothetical protein